MTRNCIYVRIAARVAEVDTRSARREIRMRPEGRSEVCARQMAKIGANPAGVDEGGVRTEINSAALDECRKRPDGRARNRRCELDVILMIVERSNRPVDCRLI